MLWNHLKISPYLKHIINYGIQTSTCHYWLEISLLSNCYFLTVLADQYSRLVVMAKCHWLKWRNRWVAKWLGVYCMAENSSSPKYTNAILPLHRLTTNNHHYYHYSHMTIVAITTSRLAEWTFSRQTANTSCAALISTCCPPTYLRFST